MINPRCKENGLLCDCIMISPTSNQLSSPRGVRLTPTRANPNTGKPHSMS